MIISRIIGGLGNQLFQYALGKSLSIHYNSPLSLDISEFEHYSLFDFSLSHFKIKADFFNPHSLPNRIKGKLYKTFGQSYFLHYQETHSAFDPNVFCFSPHTNIYLDGYWQTEKYFKEIRPLLLEDFRLNTPLSTYAAKIQSEIQTVNAVSLHVRRGDYISNPEAAKIYAHCEEAYYQKAYQTLCARIKDPVFFIFSDDINWAKAHLSFVKPAIFIDDPERHNYEDLELMRSCKHNIIANSSFSWWGAWLNDHPDKCVIAPVQWYDSSVRQIAHLKIDTRDLIPETWIKL